MLKKILLIFAICCLVFLIDCSDERLFQGKIIYLETGKNNVFKYPLTLVAIIDDSKKLHCVAKQGYFGTEIKKGDVVLIRYSIYTLTVTMEKIILNDKEFRGLIWKNLISIKKL